MWLWWSGGRRRTGERGEGRRRGEEEEGGGRGRREGTWVWEPGRVWESVRAVGECARVRRSENETVVEKGERRKEKGERRKEKEGDGETEGERRKSRGR